MNTSLLKLRMRELSDAEDSVRGAQRHLHERRALLVQACKAERLARGISLRTMARLAGCSPALLSSIENGKHYNDTVVLLYATHLLPGEQ